MQAERVLEADGVCKRWGDLPLFAGVDLVLQRGETLGIVGRSGSGKSTLLKMFLGLVRPDAGAVRVFGDGILGLDDVALSPYRRRVGMMFQSYALFDSLTVRENVAYPLRVAGERDEDVIGERVGYVLDLVNLAGVEAKMPTELSGGMKKRVSLARTIAASPEVLLYDAPTTGLDPANSKRVDQIIRKLQRELGVSAILATHDMRSLRRCADRVAMLDAGQVVWSGPIDMLDAAPDVVREFVRGG
jgi:phospholipid/cholesterol/gamma-HCH transport system ATP-binding protein